MTDLEKEAAETAIGMAPVSWQDEGRPRLGTNFEEKTAQVAAGGAPS